MLNDFEGQFTGDCDESVYRIVYNFLLLQELVNQTPNILFQVKNSKRGNILQ
jgi:hypothetical protein